jgi:hypothetical protein
MAAVGGSLALIAVGAILKWAVTGHLSWLDIQTTGTVLFVIGLVALAVSLVYTFWLSAEARAKRDGSQTRPTRPPPGGGGNY